MQQFWVLEHNNLFYAGHLEVSTDLEHAFKYGKRELAEEFKNRVPGFSNYSIVECMVVIMKTTPANDCHLH